MAAVRQIAIFSLAITASLTLNTITALAGLAQSANSPANDADFVKHLNAGVGFAKSGKMPDAISELKKAAAIKPNDPLLLMNLGQSYQVSGKNIEALEQYKKYLSLYPKGQYVPQITAMFKAMQNQVMLSGGKTSQGQDNYLSEALAPGGGRWDPSQMPLTVFIDSGKNVKGFKDEFPDIFKRAFTDWSDASQGKISVSYVESADKARIICKWTDNVKDLANPAEGGQALVKMGPGHSIFSADITLLCSGPNVPADIAPDNYMRHICLHEIGHALGLGGHSSQPGDIMFSVMNYDSNEKNLSDRDKKTMLDLYISSEALNSSPGATPVIIQIAPKANLSKPAK
jgi:tetratricopeptide (TPR) repeat protein